MYFQWKYPTIFLRNSQWNYSPLPPRTQVVGMTSLAGSRLLPARAREREPARGQDLGRARELARVLGVSISGIGLSVKFWRELLARG